MTEEDYFVKSIHVASSDRLRRRRLRLGTEPSRNVRVLGPLVPRDPRRRPEVRVDRRDARHAIRKLAASRKAEPLGEIRRGVLLAEVEQGVEQRKVDVGRGIADQIRRPVRLEDLLEDAQGLERAFGDAQRVDRCVS